MTGAKAKKASESAASRRARIPRSPPPSLKRRSARLMKQTAVEPAAPDPVPILPVEANPDKHDDSCARCGDGGDLMACSDCPRVFCYDCIKLPGAPQVLDIPEMTFLCPRCHLDRDYQHKKKTGKRVKAPYTGLLISNEPYTESYGFAKVLPAILRGNFPRMDTSPLGIVVIRLKAINAETDPSDLVYRYLRTAFTARPEALLYCVREFDIKPGEPSTLEFHQRELDSIVARMESAGCERVLVILYTHSTPSGDLHVEDGVSLEAGECLDVIFGQALCEFAARRSSILVIISCGGLYNNDASSDAVGDLAERNIFHHIFGFGGRRFLPHYAAGFLQKLAWKLFIERFSVDHILHHILGEEEGLGAHSTVLHFTSQVAMEWAWYHNQRQPQCVLIGMQCPDCGRLNSLDVKYKKYNTVVKCKHKPCRSKALSIPKDQWLYNCDGGMSVGSGWASRTLWIA